MRNIRVSQLKKILVGGLSLSLLSVGSWIMLPNNAKAAVTAASITGAGITNNTSSASAALTPTINFTLASSVSSTGTITLVLAGTTAIASIASADITAGGACSGTVTLSGSPVTSGTFNGNQTLAITGLTCTTGSNATIAIVASRLTASATTGNYGMTIQTPSEGGGFIYTVANANQVQVTGTIAPTLAFAIRNSGDTADLGYINGGTVGPHLCNLGVMTTATNASCLYRLKVSTNAASGYTVNYSATGGLVNGSGYTFANAPGTSTTATLQSTNTEAYGIVLTPGSVTGTGGSTSRGGTFGSTANFLYAYATTSSTALYSSNKPNAPTSTDTTNTALIEHDAVLSASTAAGTYTSTVTYTVSPAF